MDEQQANDLAGRIRAQFAHVSTVVLESADPRNAPRNWFIGVQRKESAFEGVSIHIHSETEWIDALHVLFVLQPPYKQAEPKQDYDPAILDERNPFTPPV